MVEQFAVYKTKPFARFARRAGIDDAVLWKAAVAANEGRTDADLGGGVVKQRIALSGKGKSGGARSIILLRRHDRAIFVYGFEKKDRANIDATDLTAFREFADIILNISRQELMERVQQGAMLVVTAPKERSHG